MLETDINLFLYLNELFSGKCASIFFSLITHLGNGLVTGLLVIGSMYLFKAKKLRRHFIPMVLSVAVSGAAVNIIKPIVNRPRPANYFAGADIEVHTPKGTPSDKSFPSGHTQAAFGAATYLSCLYPAASPIFLGLAALTGLSRIAIGVHYPLDVLVGALFGIVFSLAGFRWYRSYARRKSRERPFKCVVLFDIDGTLISSPAGRTSTGSLAMNDASIEIAHQPARFTGADYAGRTDIQIARMLLEDAGISSPSKDKIDAFIDAYLTRLAERIPEHPSCVLGNPRAAVEALRKEGATVGLGTGNVRSGARLKLDSAKIGDLFEPLLGGFGEDGETRAELLEAGARLLNPDRTLPVIIVGDTPKDVEGAKKISALCIGVPFGKNDRTVLESAGADVVVDTLDESLVEVVRKLL